MDGNWIPCGFKMPEDGIYVLVQMIFGEEFYIMSFDKENDCWRTLEESIEWEKDMVEAWMPLPEPWKEGD